MTQTTKSKKTGKKQTPPSVSAKKGADGKLPDKKRHFAQLYVLYLSKTEAAKKAGYSAKTANSKGHALYKEPAVRAEIDRLIKERAERNELSSDYVLMSLKEIADRCMQHVAPVLNKRGEQVYVEDREGREVPAYTFNALGATKPLELIGKHLGMFVDKKEISGTLTLADLARELEGEDEE